MRRGQKKFFELKDKIEFPTNAEFLLMKTQEREEEEEIAKGLHRFLTDLKVQKC